MKAVISLIFFAASGASTILLRDHGDSANNARLFARQASTPDPTSVPTQCSATCSPFFLNIGRCGSTDSACLCTAAVRNDGVACFNCIASIVPSSLKDLQDDADEDVELCKEDGITIDPIKITPTAPSNNTSTTGGIPSLPTTGLGPSPTDGAGKASDSAGNGAVQTRYSIYLGTVVAAAGILCTWASF